MNKEPYKVEGYFDAKFIRLIDQDNKFQPKYKVADAKKLSKDYGLDLVCFEEGDRNTLPLCKIIDYGKWKYSFDKKHKEQKHHEAKEFRFSFNIDPNDVSHKIKHAEDFLSTGTNVIFTMFLKGRERDKLDLAETKMAEIVEKCQYKESFVKKTANNSIVYKIEHKRK
jgi:translation initiation factor IF-3